MTFTLRGYLRENPGGAAVAGATVNLYDTNTGAAPTTTAHTNLSGTSTTTDANGMWQFTMDLCTGPLRVEALPGSVTRHRRNDELFQYGGWPISSLPTMFRGFTSGILPGVGNEFTITSSATRSLSMAHGYAMLQGYLFGWDTGSKSVTGSANGAAGTTRWDFLCLRQWYAGSDAGKQDIVLVQGGSSTDPVATTTETDLTQFIRGATIWDQPIARCKLAFGATVYTVVQFASDAEYPYFGMNLEAVAEDATFYGTVTLEDSLTVNAGATFTGNVVIGDADSDQTTIRGHIVRAGTAPTAATAATAVVGASGTTVTSGSDGSFQTSSTVKVGATAGKILEIAFADARPSSDYAVGVTKRSSDAADYDVYVTSQGAGGFSLHCTNTPTAAETLNFAFTVQ